MISGQVLDQTNLPLSEAWVEVHANGKTMQVATNASGTWSLETAADQIQCTARCRGYIAKHFDCGAGCYYTTHLQAGDIVFKGRVVEANSGRPMENVSVKVAEELHAALALTKRDGTFEVILQAVPQWRSSVVAEGLGYAKHVHDPGRTVFGGETIDLGDLPLTLAFATIRGRLLHARSGAAIPDMPFEVVSANPDGGIDSLGSGRSDANGNFAATLPPQTPGWGK